MLTPASSHYRLVLEAPAAGVGVVCSDFARGKRVGVIEKVRWPSAHALAGHLDELLQREHAER